MRYSALVIAGCLFSAGCGGVADVKGTVSYKGKMLKFGSVTALPESGLAVQTAINEDGSYELKRVGLGDTKFLVYCQDPKFVKVVTDLAMKKNDFRGAGGKAGGRVPGGALKTGETAKALANPNLVPDKYSDQSKVLLKYTVVRGENVFNIVLEP